MVGSNSFNVCTICLTPSRHSINRLTLSCATCDAWTHIKCLGYDDKDHTVFLGDWFCPICIASTLPFNSIDNDIDFLSCIFNYSYSNNINAGLIKNSEQLELNKRYKVSNADIDPDKYFYNNLNLGNLYYFAEDFNTLFCDTSVHPTSFSIVHINTRSLHKNFASLTLFLSGLKHKFSVIAISETWTTTATESLYTIPGFNHVVRSRDGRGGGVALYIDNALSFTERADLTNNYNSNFECIFVEISDATFGNKVVGAVYRPPGCDIAQFRLGFDSVLHTIKHNTTEYIIAGDFNIDLLKHESHPDTASFIDNLYSHSFTPLIVRPTRFSETSSTLIDNILTNKPNDTFISGVFISDISDHLPVFYVLKKRNENSQIKFKTIYSRIKTDDKILKLKSECARINWPNILTNDNVNKDYDLFINKFQKIYDTVMPPTSKTIKCYSNIYKPWITYAISKSIRRKNRLYKNYLQNRNPQTLSKYKTYKNKLTNIIRAAERNYYHNKFDIAKGNITKTWKLIRELTNPNHAVAQNIPELKTGITTVTDKQNIADTFNEYFINVGRNLAAIIPAVKGDVLSYIKGNFPNSMFTTGTDATEITGIMSQLNTSASAGYDGIPGKIIEAVLPEIVNPLVIIFNKSLETGVFPDNLKIAKIIPIHKSDDKRAVSNYRPISVLPFLSKILERLMYVRLLKYLNNNDILSNNQYGFRENHSTFMALLKLVDDISEQIDSKIHSIGVFIDLSKAFDTIDHDILIKKLNRYGIRGTSLNWFISYLSNRKQYVNVNSVDSKLLSVSCGVPQGSILGPLLFILYINDIINSSKMANLIMFADDTNIFFKHKNFNILINMVNDELRLISTWFKLNKLSLNVKKTNYIIFTGKNVKRNDFANTSKIKIDNTEIEQVTRTKFLGVIINSHLTWDDHIKTLSNKISKSLGVIYKVRQNLRPNTLLTLYQTLIQPYLDYCNIVWASKSSRDLLNLHRQQKKAIRIITFSKWNAHTKPLFCRLKLLPVFDINKLQILCFTYRALKGLLPNQFNNLYVLNSHIHDHFTRQTVKIHSQPCRTKIRQYSVRIRGIKLWNSLDLNIANSPTLSIFKRLCRNQLINELEL